MSNDLQISVSGMTCDHCVQAVTKAVRSTPGAADAQVDVDLDSGVVRVEGSSADRGALVAAITDAGYEATD
jgi:copper chaperone CopZ